MGKCVFYLHSPGGLSQSKLADRLELELDGRPLRGAVDGDLYDLNPAMPPDDLG